MSTTSDNSLSRRRFISSIGVLSAAASLPVQAGELFEPTSSGALMKSDPYLQGVSSDQITIRWITSNKCYSWVEYGADRSGLDLKAHSVDDGLVSANNTIHDISISGLKPGSTYYYRVVSKRIDQFNAGKVSFGETQYSEVYSFKTLPLKKKDIRFSVFNDVHERPETFAHMYPYIGKAPMDFMVLNGDMFNAMRTGEDQILEQLLDPLNKLLSSTVPFIFARGNHETRGEYSRQLPEYINGMANKFYYSFEAGPAHMIIMDSGEDKEDDHPAYGGIVSFDEYRHRQSEWLEKEIRKSSFKNAKYKVVFIHIPPFYTAKKEAHGTKFVGQHWVPILNKAKINVLICGHTHRHGIHPPVAGLHNFPIVIGGGPKDGDRTVINVSADAGSMNLEMIDDSGKLVGSLKI